MIRLIVFSFLLTPFLIYSQNLIINGSAEIIVDNELFGWTEVQGNNWTKALEVPPNSAGYHFFVGYGISPCSENGSNRDVAELRQDIDVSLYSQAIDANNQDFIFTGYTRSWSAQMLDASRIILEYYDTDMNILTSWDSGPKTSTGRAFDPNGDLNGWVQTTSTTTAPVGTRTIRIRLESTRYQGCENDGYYDDLELIPKCNGGISTLSKNTICEGENVSLLLESYAGNIQWQESVNNGVWNNIGSNNALDSINTTPITNHLPVRYRAKVTIGNCTSYSTISDLEIKPPASSGVISAQPTSICEGESSILSINGNNGIIQWQESIDGITFSDFGNSNTSQTITPNTTNSPMNYRTISTLGTCIDTSEIQLITIYPNANGGYINTTATTICDGESIDLTLMNSSGNIEWQQRMNSGIWSAFGLGQTTVTLSPTSFNSPIEYRAFLTAGSCIDSSAIIQINVNPAASSGTISAQPSSLCEGESSILSINGNNGIIQWQESIDGITFSDFGNSNTSQTITPNITNSPMNYRTISTLGTCIDTSSITSVIIHPSAKAGSINIDQSTICESDSAFLNITNEIGIIQWQQSFNNDVWVNRTSTSIKFTQAESPINFRAISILGACLDTSNIVTLSILPSPPKGSIIYQDTLCYNQSDTLILSENTESIQWQKEQNDVFVNIASNSNKLNITALENYPVKYRALLSNGFCEVISDTAIIITLNPIGGIANLESTSICEGSSTQLYLSESINDNIQWQQAINGNSFTDFGTISNVQSVSPIFDQTPIQYRAIVFMGANCTDTSSITTLNITPKADAGLLNIIPDSICLGSSETITLSDFIGSIQWQQSLSNNEWTNIETVSNSILITPTESDIPTYYRAIVTNGNCTDTSNIDSLGVVIIEGGTTFTNTPSICHGENTIITLSNYTGNIQWQQIHADGHKTNLTSTSSSLYVSPTYTESPVNYQALITQSFCTATSSPTTITVDTLPSNIKFLNKKDTICGNSSNTFSILPIENVDNYIWTISSGTLTQLAPEKIVLTTDNNDNSTTQITVTGTNTCGSGTETKLNVVILEHPNITILNKDTIICEGDEIKLMAINNNGNITPEMNIQWYLDGEKIIGETSNSLITSRQGSHKISYDNRGYCSSFSSNDVLVTNATMAIDAGDDKTIYPGESIILNAYSSDNFSYNWTPDSTIVDNTVLQPLVTPSINTTYMLTAINSIGCMDTSSVNILVSEKINAPNAFSPNGDGYNDLWMIDRIDDWSPVNVTIYNRWGSIVYESLNNYIPWNGNYKGRPSPVGTYYYIITFHKTNEVFTGAVTLVK